jgi:hypothetical protein
MENIIVKTDSFNDAKNVLEKVYQSDKSATYCNGKKTVIGSAISGYILNDNSVKIESSFYNETSLKEIFNK